MHHTCIFIGSKDRLLQLHDFKA